MMFYLDGKVRLLRLDDFNEGLIASRIRGGANLSLDETNFDGSNLKFVKVCSRKVERSNFLHRFSRKLEINSGMKTV